MPLAPLPTQPFEMDPSQPFQLDPAQGRPGQEMMESGLDPELEKKVAQRIDLEPEFTSGPDQGPETTPAGSHSQGQEGMRCTAHSPEDHGPALLDQIPGVGSGQVPAQSPVDWKLIDPNPGVERG